MKYKFKKLIVHLKDRLTEIIADHRIDKLKSGKMKTISMEDIFAKAHIKL